VQQPLLQMLLWCGAVGVWGLIVWQLQSLVHLLPSVAHLLQCAVHLLQSGPETRVLKTVRLGPLTEPIGCAVAQAHAGSHRKDACFQCWGLGELALPAMAVLQQVLVRAAVDEVVVVPLQGLPMPGMLGG